MACNENVIKNMANEVARNCQAFNVSVEPEFVIYLIELLLLDPKYGKLFSKSINRVKLAYFVEECVNAVKGYSIAMNTLKMQFILQINYDKLPVLLETHADAITGCLKPLINEILDADPDPNDEGQLKKLFRKISVYFILASGLGNPANIVALKEGICALESVFGIEDLMVFIAMTRTEKAAQLAELLEVVSGVRLFNRDCKKGGESISDLPFNLLEAGKASMYALSNSLISVMQKVNKMTTAVEDSVGIDEETGNVYIRIKPDNGLTKADYLAMYDMLALNRQYEVFVRKLLSDVETVSRKAEEYVERERMVLNEIHSAVKYKAAVPIVTVFPLFRKLWVVWRAMQDVMYVISTVNKLMTILDGIQDSVKTPTQVLSKMLQGRTVVTDHERMSFQMSLDDRISMASIHNYVSYSDSNFNAGAGTNLEFLGFCAVCLSVGALVPSKQKIGSIKKKGRFYGFCSLKMALRFSKDPQRYINEALTYARNNPHLINLLNILNRVVEVREIESLVVKQVPKKKTVDQDIQTETHPILEHIEKNYTSDLWEWKRRACQWAKIVNCQTHSTQTNYSHLRSEIQCQTTELKDKTLQTKKDCGINTINNNYFLWGLRGQNGMGQHSMDLRVTHEGEKKSGNDALCINNPRPETTHKLVTVHSQGSKIIGQIPTDPSGLFEWWK